MAATDASARRRRALLVATATYADPGLAALRSPTGDVQALAEVLADGSIGEFEVSQLIDRPTEEIKREIEGFFDAGRPQDLLLLYVSGHGVLSQSRRFYFATTTTALRWLRATAVEDSFVNDVMQHSRARSIVLLLDCCHSGAFAKGLAPKSPLTVDVEHRFEGRGRVTLSASTELEYAFEEAEPAADVSSGHAAPGSLFTRCLVEGLATGNADMDADGKIAIDELYDYVCQRMRDRTARQTPGMAGDVRGDIVIARSQRAVELPTELQQAINSPLAGVREGSVTELARLLRSAEPGLGLAAKAALERLAEDDSQRVSSGALAVLSPQPPAEPSTKHLPPPAPERHRDRVPRRARSRVAIVAAAGAAIAAAAVTAAIVAGPKDTEGGTVAYDFDGDGAQEIVIAPVHADSAGVIIHGGPEARRAQPISAAAAGATGVGPDEGFGAAVSSADFNGDGHADLAVGTPDHDLVTVLYGTPNGLTGRRQRFDGAAVQGKYGFDVVGRDLDHDGFGDLVVGAPGTGRQRGVVHVLFGSDGGLRTRHATTLEAPGGVPEDFGNRLRTGDVDGDGHVDLVEGAPDSDGAHLTYCRGSQQGPSPCRLLPPLDDDNGTSALAIADVNGDGRDDIVQGDTWLAPEGSGGGLRVWFGEPGGPAHTPELIRPRLAGFDDVAPNADFGQAVDAGRLDGDGYADIVVGVPGYRGGVGGVALIRGGPDGPAKDGHMLDAAPGSENHRFGQAVALLHLGGSGTPPAVVVVAEDAPADAFVQVIRGEGGPIKLHGLADAVKGDIGETRLGLASGV